ncbi:MAG: D-alanine--D-alanine ligase [Chloroflexi bacterium]|nr:MAG: D-alanine--D-alanine ligase [Chloroflexota bacterium]
MKKESKLQVGVIFGGVSGEHEVSLMSARSVLNALDPEKYDVYQIGITKTGDWLAGENVIDELEQEKYKHTMPVSMLPTAARKGLFRIRETSRGDTLQNMAPLDVVFPVLHGTFGEDGSIQGFLEIDDIAYVGAGVLASAVGMDKALFRDVMIANSIPVVESILVLKTEIEGDISAVIEMAENFLHGRAAPYPLFVKPANLGSSVGITKCRSRSDLYEGLIEAARYDRRVLVERSVSAREIEVSVLGNNDPIASVPGEIIPSREFYSYEAKYIDNTSGLLIPAPIPADVSEKVRTLAVKAYKAIDCAGMARVDFFLDKETSELFVSEINTIPGFTQISMYAKLWEASGISYGQLLDKLIDLALDRKAEKDKLVREYQAP